MSIKDGKLIYHLTDINNIENIIQMGLLSRKTLIERGMVFEDVAEPEILQFRKLHDLDEYVPFHFFARNPFDGRVQKSYPDSEFAYLCMSRDKARELQFEIIPRHPLNMAPFMMYTYEDGMEIIEWDKMERRDYSDKECKEICMAECVHKGDVDINDIFSINVKTEENKAYVESILRKYGINSIYVNAAPNYFV